MNLGVLQQVSKAIAGASAAATSAIATGAVEDGLSGVDLLIAVLAFLGGFALTFAAPPNSTGAPTTPPA